jgi:hypothetical protein
MPAGRLLVGWMVQLATDSLPQIRRGTPDAVSAELCTLRLGCQGASGPPASAAPLYSVVARILARYDGVRRSIARLRPREWQARADRPRPDCRGHFPADWARALVAPIPAGGESSQAASSGGTRAAGPGHTCPSSLNDRPGHRRPGQQPGATRGGSGRLPGPAADLASRGRANYDRRV